MPALSSTASPLPPPQPLLDVFRGVLLPLRRYHRYSVVGLEHVPATGPALLALHHSLASYDGFLLALSIYEATGRVPAALGDDLIFRFAGLGKLASVAGIYPASPQMGERLLQQGHLLMVAPGGMREALRSSRERYHVKWEDRLGFARLSLSTGAPLILAACPAADDIFTVYDSRLTWAAYHRLKVPLPLFRGVGPTLVPRPVTLTHYLAPPIIPPPLCVASKEEQVRLLHERALSVMAELTARRG